MSRILLREGQLRKPLLSDLAKLGELAGLFWGSAAVRKGADRLDSLESKEADTISVSRSNPG
jgi:hypothetical protein